MYLILTNYSPRPKNAIFNNRLSFHPPENYKANDSHVNSIQRINLFSFVIEKGFMNISWLFRSIKMIIGVLPTAYQSSEGNSEKWEKFDVVFIADFLPCLIQRKQTTAVICIMNQILPNK